MGRNLPSLDLLRGFEAAARTLSFTKAAGELFITQSAVSRQIKALEEHLGVALFQRMNRALLLTDAGQTFYRTASLVLGLVEEAVAKLSHPASGSMVTVTASVSFAALWLVPRLTSFRQAHPEIDVRISANNEILNLQRDRIDLAVRFCKSEAAPKNAIRLFGEEVFPVCSPSVLRDRSKPLKKPADLAKHVLLHIDDPDGRWPGWNGRVVGCAQPARPQTGWFIALQSLRSTDSRRSGRRRGGTGTDAAGARAHRQRSS
jgi:DNA-binding transcriptional LysR family regulator